MPAQAPLRKCGKELLHPGRSAILLELFQPHLVNARILILVLNLIAALLDAGGDGSLLARLRAQQSPPLRQRKWIARTADRRREIARRRVAGSEVLMELPVGWREDHSMLPVDAEKILLA